MLILFHPYARRYPKSLNPKTYPYSKKLCELLKADGHKIIQIGCKGKWNGYDLQEDPVTEICLYDQSLQAIEDLLKGCDLFICVDSFLQHMAHNLGIRGLVLWGPSHVKNFGYKTNKNILPLKPSPAQSPFHRWDMIPYDATLFAPPEVVVEAVNNWGSDIFHDLKKK
jgi:ADP-heptose:LPS heptosyltransferase